MSGPDIGIDLALAEVNQEKTAWSRLSAVPESLLNLLALVSLFSAIHSLIFDSFPRIFEILPTDMPLSLAI